jgi:hypothetical protein
LGHELTVKFGEEQVEYVQQFNLLLPVEGRSHWISYFDGYGGRPTWHSYAKLHGRYEISMWFEVNLDRRNGRFTLSEEPDFQINEVTLVELPKSNEHGISCRFGEQFSFGLDEWKTLVQNKGDFEKIGIFLKKISPVEHFERVLR